MSLGLCASCKRHARAGEPCPFCNTLIAAGSHRPTRSHVSRAALVMVGALVTQCDCKQETIAQPYGAPPRPDLPAIDAGPTAPPDAGVVPPRDKQ